MSDMLQEDMMTTTLPPSEISPLTDGQEIVISILSLISGSLSVMGSSMIVYLVIKNSRKTPYKRILLGLSLCDIVASITYAINPFLLPADSSQRLWASGSDASCDFLGFLTQFAFSAIWYNGMLSWYYMFTVRFGIKTATFASRFEPVIHLLCIGYNLGTAVTGYVRGFYSEMELGQGCWIAEYPEGCEATDTCTGATIGWIFGGLPTVFMFLSIIVNNLVICWYVRRTSHRTRRKSMRGLEHQNQRVQAVATQAFLYVGTFMIAYSWAFSIKVAESMGVQAADEAGIYPVLVLQAIFLPMQGVFNLLVYSRPNYLRYRQEFPKETRRWALRRAWFGTAVPRRRSVDASITSAYMSSRPIANIEQARQRAASQFSATFSSKDPLRRDFRIREAHRSSVTFDLTSTQIMHSNMSSDEDDDASGLGEEGEQEIPTEAPEPPSIAPSVVDEPSPEPLDDRDEPMLDGWDGVEESIESWGDEKGSSPSP